MTDQELFDRTLKLIREQGEPSYDSSTYSCKYRYMKSDGKVLKCAAGVHLPDNKCDGFEGDNCGLSPDEITVCNTIKSDAHEYFESLGYNTTLLRECQIAHDEAARNNDSYKERFIVEFNEKMKKVAETYKLSYTE